MSRSGQAYRLATHLSETTGVRGKLVYDTGAREACHTVHRVASEYDMARVLLNADRVPAPHSPPGCGSPVRALSDVGG